MRWQTTAVLAVVLAALGAFYYVYEIRLGPERQKAEAQKGRLLAGDTKDVTALTLRRADSTVVVRREGEQWQVEQPVRTRGDRGAIEETITSLLMARREREVASAPAAPADFGLDPPAAEATLTLAGGTTLAVELGSKSPTGAWVYARLKNTPAVVLLPDTVLRDATRPVADFRDKTVLAVNRADVTGFEVVLPGETLAVEARDNHAWAITRPVSLPADTETVTEFLDKLSAARVREFVADAPPSLAPYGLERPVTVAIHTGRDKDRTTRSLLLGSVDPAKKGVYAMWPGERSVLLLPEETWTATPRTVAALRDRVLVAYQRDKVTRLEVESGKGAVTVARDGDRWKITAPESLPADQVSVSALLSRLAEVRAQGFLSDDASGIPRFLARPDVRVTLTREGADPLTVLLAAAPDRRGGQPTAYAAVAGKGPVMLVDAKVLADLGRSASELRDRTLISGLEPRDVKRVRLRAGGQTVVVERSGTTEWRMLEPARAAARGAKIEDLLYALRGLRWTEIVAPSADEPARWGLDAPRLEITLVTEGGKELPALTLGRADGERAYVKIGAAPAVYAIDGRALGEVPRLPDDLKAG
jgi:hypothetical protein